MQVLLVVAAATSPDAAVLDALSGLADVRQEQLETADGGSAERAAVDRALEALGDTRLAIAADVAVLNAVLRRLLQRERLELPIALVPTAGPADAAGRVGRLDTRPEAVAAAVTGSTTVPMALARDDHGGVLVHEATVTPLDGTEIGGRLWVDETALVDGPLRSIRLWVPHPRNDATAPAAELAVPLMAEVLAPGRLTLQAFRRRERVTTARTGGRAVALSCDPAQLTVDDVPHPRPLTKRNWWIEPNSWRLRVTGPDYSAG